MKKIILIIFLFLVGCLVIFNKNNDNSERKIESSDEKRGIFVSYIDLSKYIKNSNSNISQNNIIKLLDNVSSLNFNMIVLQVVSFSDSIYKSNIYPWSSVISSYEGVAPGYDVLDYFIKKAHERGILVYIWINPYRVRSSNNIDSIT